MSERDVIDTAAGLSESPVATLRRQRADFVRFSQGSHEVLLHPADPGGVSLQERAACALRVAAVEGETALVSHYRQELQDRDADAATMAAAETGSESAAPRLAAILRHVTAITKAPGQATRAQLDALLAAGLSPQDAIVITQIVAFVSHQVRVVCGLRALAADVGTRA